MIQPPQWAYRFLKWYCHPRYLEEIEGDIYELFERRVQDQSLKKARLRYIWDVFRFFRWSNIKRSNSKHTQMNQLVLIKNYLKLGMRNIQKNVVSSSINIFGLSIAICFTISIYVFADMMLNMDTFHTKGDHIYQITNYVDQDGSNELWGDSPIELGPRLLSDHPSVESFTRVEYEYAALRKNTDAFDELVLFVDPAFFEMFDFPMLNGTRQVLYEKNHIVISKDMALKYFKGEDPMGKEINVKFVNGKMKRMTVGAVLDEYPYNSGIQFNFYLPMDNFFDLDFKSHYGWSLMTDATFVLLKEGHDILKITESFDEYVALQNESNPEWIVIDYLPIPLTELSTKAYSIKSGVVGGAHPAGIRSLFIASLLLLGMACFNFMNISVVSASKRLKEIALRKVMGSYKREVVKQFMIENLLQCFFALIVGTLLAYFVLVPWFDAIIHEMDLKLRTDNPMDLGLFLVGLLILTGLISGTYPSFYISRFDAITIFRGKEKFGSKNLFSKIMLGVQFFLAIMTVVGCFVFVDQSIHMNSKDWGYDPEGAMSIYVESEDQYELLKNEILKHPAVENYTTSNYLLGRGLGVSSLEMGDRQIPFKRLGISEDYFEVFGLRLLDGRLLTDKASDQNTNVIVNQQFIASMGWEGNALSKTFTYDSVIHKVVGVVQDFHYDDFYQPIEPLMISVMDPAEVRYITVQANTEQLVDLEVYVRTAWQKIAPNDPFDREFQTDVFDHFYSENNNNIKVMLLITGIAIVLACLGLYGLLSYNVYGKLKEFSVRKVLGAEPKTIVKLASKQYIWVLLISFILGAPLGALTISGLVTSIYPEPKPVSALPFIVAMLIILITLIITVAGQINKAIKVNPADLLRSE